MKQLQQEVTSFNSSTITPNEQEFGLQVAAAWSTLVQVFIALQSNLIRQNEPAVVQMLYTSLQMLKQVTE